MARLFASIFLSLYGDWLTTVALVVVLFQLTGSAAGPAGYILARVAPRTLGPFVGGRLADRLSPRAVMVTAAALQAALIGSLIAAHAAHLVWGIYAAVAVGQFLGAVARPSQGAMLPLLVSDAALPRANATYALFFSTSLFVAPAIGAALLTTIGPDALFAVDAVSFVISAALATSLPSGSTRSRAGSVTTTAEHAPAFRLASALRQPLLRLVVVSNFTTAAAVTVVQAFLVVAAHERLGSDASVGYLYAAVGVGGTVGGLIGLRSIPAPRRMTAAFAMATVLALLALGGFAVAVRGDVAVLLLALSALGTASIDVWGFTEVQRRAPPGQLGRYSAITWMAQYAGMLVGAVAALAASSVARWDRIVEVACAVLVAMLAAIWLSLPVRGTAREGAPTLTGWIDLAEERRRQALARAEPEGR